jgi:putative nucleotidyltransferase with HDIG domain
MLQIPTEILNSIESLQMQTAPQILLRFLRLAEDDRTTMFELATLVGQDPSLSARILTVANSPALLRGVASKNLTQCMVTLGTRLARTLAACLVIRNVFSSAVAHRKYDFSAFWSHSLLVAEVARDISEEVSYADVEEAYLSGLLHDIGQLLLLEGMEENYGKLLESSKGETDLLNFEEITLGTNHSEIGAWLADQWNLPSFMADSILFHHKTAEQIASADRLSQIVWVSHVLCDQISLMDLTDTTATPNLDAITAVMGINASRAVSIHQNCSERVAVIAEMIGINRDSAAHTLPSAFDRSLDHLSVCTQDGDQVYSQMEEAVRDMALMHPLQHGLTALMGESEILFGIRESARILFGPGRLAFLLVRPDKPVLSGANVTGQPEILQRLEIQLGSPLSLAAEAALGKQPRSTFEAERPAAIALVDAQIIRALGGDGVVYLPLPGHTKNIGVMAFGVSTAHHLRLRPQLAWMMSFARMAANSIETWRDMQERIHSVEMVLTKRFEQQARKVVHEAGNPLGIINNYLNIIRNKLPDTNDLQQELDILKEEIDRVTNIVRKMNSLQEHLPAASTLDINTLIESMLVLYGQSLFTSRGISVEKTLDPLLKPIACNRDSLKQVLVNLWNNAADAMSDGGCFAVSTHADVNQDGRAFIEIHMSDTGPGLPPDVLQRLYQPLEPNRRPGHSGIGLSIVAGLIEQLDGCISCRSNAGQGTHFSILLPQSTETKT